MDSRSVTSLLVILMMIFYQASSDFAQDKEECQDQLVSLSPCIAFVSGHAKAPTPSCCTELRKDTSSGNSTLVCLCILVKDRDEPSLGFKLNATLALRLPSICHLQSIAAKCPELLKLAPNSTEAQVFEQFDNTSGFGNSTSAGDVVPSSSTTLGVNRIRQAAGGVLAWILLSV